MEGKFLNLNKNLGAARRNRNDEFYTQLSDIERELRHYRHHFKDKVIYCNCDDPRVSNFFHYFSYNFERLGLKKIITTCYQNQEIDLFSQHDVEQAISLEYTGEHNGGNVPTVENIGVNYLKGDGDFRSAECIELLKEADIVVTNPPFSLFREYVNQLMEYEKTFLIIGNFNATTYKDVFQHFKKNKIWIGYSPRNMEFLTPKGEKKSVNASWFTNLDISKRHEDIILYETYSPEKYPKYVNFDAIEVGQTNKIPQDYDGLMGVPITFLERYNPEQFELVGTSLELAHPMSEFAEKGEFMTGGNRFYINEKSGKYLYRRMYDRVVIRNKKVVK